MTTLEIAAPLGLFLATLWTLTAALLTAGDRFALRLTADMGPDAWTDAIDATSRLRHLARRLTLRGWRDLYPPSLIAATQANTPAGQRMAARLEQAEAEFRAAKAAKAVARHPVGEGK